jgi:hypothetical protein
MKRVVTGAALLALATASCSPLRSGREHYGEGMRLLRYDPAWAREEFESAAADLAEALARPGLDPGDDLLARSIRIRCLIELDRHAEVNPPPPEGGGFDARLKPTKGRTA